MRRERRPQRNWTAIIQVTTQDRLLTALLEVGCLVEAVMRLTGAGIKFGVL